MKCTMCGEMEATIKIFNPNFDEDGMWNVCKGCDTFIKGGQKLAFAEILHYKRPSKFTKGLLKEAQEEMK